MEDNTSNEDDYYLSDRESFDGLDSFEPDLHCGPSKRPSCKVITKESLLVAQREDLCRVMDLLSLREHHARTLLIYYRWNAENLFAVFVEKGKDCLFAEAGLSVVENHDLDSQPPPTVLCNICMEDVPGIEVTKMDCGHSFCNECWTGHFVVKINEGQSKRIQCMAHKCNAICNEAIVRNLVSKMHPHLAEKFDRFLLESYIEDNKMVKWCPSTPHCGNAIRVEEDEFCEVQCSCGLQFCFSCLAVAHSPCSCSMWELWTKKCRDESATVKWITVHTKPCPKCHKAVEKNGGCNLVRCICGQRFCWLCGGATGRDHTYTHITGHSCGRYEGDEKKTEFGKRYLYRYMHYHSRYKAHIDSFKRECKLKGTLKKKVVNLGKMDSQIRDFRWVKNGLYRLSISRRVLTYSYAFAYIMFGDELFKDEMTKEEREIKQRLFEDQQQQLEANVEKLSNFLEVPFDQFTEDKVMEIRMQVINLSVITDNRCKKMYECIENDLLGSLQFGIHNIAPYHSKGIEKATELSVCWNPNVTNTHEHQSSDYHAKGKSKLAITKTQALQLKDVNKLLVNHFDCIVTAETSPKYLLDSKHREEANKEGSMKVSKEVLAKLRADRGAVVEGEPSRKRQMVTREANTSTLVDSPMFGAQGVVIFELPHVVGGKRIEEVIDVSPLPSASKSKEHVNDDSPSIQADPNEAMNKLVEFGFADDVRMVNDVSDKELCVKTLESLGQTVLHTYTTAIRCFANFKHSKVMEEMIRKMDGEKEDLAALLNEEREEKEKLEEELALRNGQFQSLTDTVFARDKEVASLNQEMERLQKSVSSAKEAGAVEYQKSQAFTDSMTMYFFDGFEAFRRCAMSSYPKVDLTQFEVDDDLQSHMAVEEEERGGELADDEASKVETSIIAETRVEKSLA
ncbi:probable E3 ubiquitin-protein ligase ARI2 isoform X3 [Rhododendron vialii]|uniref:probable E3 ubiquitin-protein ligase ARI2 isoform X3 n=1 Tax=Rhododendron vialii TaxID=182163 RepID=UPI00265DE253|nr:probable E3 ubiquitin-protein ligase ARI2 isoform X3 [Rhododendron vialii]